jgi:hypothetical protein
MQQRRGSEIVSGWPDEQSAQGGSVAMRRFENDPRPPDVPEPAPSPDPMPTPQPPPGEPDPGPQGRCP